ncbi:hypothetical protein [Streptomyces californicus]|uniref:hypothetical protein n=1 Tax=Streptomyces californicus TaxID=67351 RepID=UPI0004C06B70|nr:hypothetical protein [Streptomyces californicus]QRV53490.1 hypothetical protein I6J40_04215 [Streptomyces californicus]
MSERDTLLALFLRGGDGSQPEFEQALDDYAHELAERVRADVAHISYGSATDYANRHADLIDPEVSSA